MLKPRACDAPWRFYEQPEGTIEYEQIIDGWLRTWKEYVPSCYDGSHPVPLVLSVHGAAHHSADSYTAWQLIAERENFIVVYPHSLIEEIKFNVWNTFSQEEGMPDDVRYFDQLIDIICEKYNIDTRRIYMQGQSMGDLMVSTYLFSHGDRIAAAAPLSGPACCSAFYTFGDPQPHIYPHHALPVIRTHGSEDTQQPLGTMGKICIMSASGEEKPTDFSDTARYNKWVIGQKPNIDLWLRANGCDPLPKLGMRGRYAWFVYEGHPNDLVFYIVEGGEHGPYLDMADNIWTYFFSRYRRVNGKVEEIPDAPHIRPDTNAIALAEGASLAYVNNQLVPLDEKQRITRVIENHYYVPADFLETAFPDTKVMLYEEGTAAHITIGSNRMQIAMGNRAVVWNESLRDMPTTLYFDGSLYVPIEAIAELAFHFHSARDHGACYICETGGMMSYDFAYVIRELLGTQKPVTTDEILLLEDELRAAGNKQYAAHNIGGDKYSGTQEEIFALLKNRYQEQYEAYLSRHEK